MTDAAIDPYSVLGISPDASDAELRRAHRELVKRHHPDHNGGSPESAARFAQIQNAYAVVLESRRSPDPHLENRIANMEQELAQMRAQEQRQARDRARQTAAKHAAAAAAAAAQSRRPTDEELGYFSTEDSFTKIIDDAAEQLADRVRASDGKRQFTQRLSDLFGRKGS